MTALYVLAGWFLAALGLGVLIGKGIHAADRAQEAVDAPEWSDAAVRFEFDLLVPSMVTAESFELDALLNRKSRGAL